MESKSIDRPPCDDASDMIAIFVVCGGSGGGGDYLCSSILLVCLVLFKQ